MSTVETAIDRPTLIRDLTNERFEELYSTDRFTATVLANNLRYAVQHVATGLLYRAFSPIIALAMDFAGAICGPPEQGYQMVAVTNGLTVFLGTIQDGVRVAVEEYGIDRLEPGDLLICNDPTRMGNHPNDMCFIRPVFHEGRIVSFMVMRAHLTDIGGVTPGGFTATKRNSYENGLVLSPRLMFHREEPVRETMSLIFDNARFGQIALPDFHTIQGCCKLGESLILENIDRYGVDAYLGTLRYACDTTAERIRTRLEELPDGDYEGEDFVDADAEDADEEYRVHLNVKKRGGRLEVDFSGSSRQARTSINAGALDAKTSMGVALKMLLDPEGDFTSGSFRHLDLVLPPGSIASALPPEGPIFLYWEVTNAAMAALIRALADALGERAIGGDCGSNNVHNAFGVKPDGTAWACGSMAGGETGPVGANREADGEGQISPYLINILAPSSEGLEAGFPVMIMRKEYATDTSGPGFNRGGAAILKDVMWTEVAEHQTCPLRFRHPSGMGVQGAGAGAQGGIWIFDEHGREMEGQSVYRPQGSDAYADAIPVAGMIDPESNALDPDGEFAYYGSRPVWKTEPGATWRYLTNGGGGWGDPLERDPERVRRDVRDGYVSVEAAAREFGVVVTGDPEHDPEGVQVDAAATAARRGELASMRG